MIFRQNLVKILYKISDNVTAPLILGLLLRLFNDSLFSTMTPGQNLSPTDRRQCNWVINIFLNIAFVKDWCTCIWNKAHYANKTIWHKEEMNVILCKHLFFIFLFKFLYNFKHSNVCVTFSDFWFMFHGHIKYKLKINKTVFMHILIYDY